MVNFRHKLKTFHSRAFKLNENSQTIDKLPEKTTGSWIFQSNGLSKLELLIWIASAHFLTNVFTLLVFHIDLKMHQLHFSEGKEKQPS